MATRNVKLTNEQVDRLDSIIGQGLFANEQDALNEALRLAEEKTKALMAAVQVGIDDIAAGRFETFDSPEALKAKTLEIWDTSDVSEKVA